MNFLIYIVKISNTVHKKDRGVKVPFDLFTLKENYGALREIDKLQKNVFVPAINEEERRKGRFFYFYFYVKVPTFIRFPLTIFEVLTTLRLGFVTL